MANAATSNLRTISPRLSPLPAADTARALVDMAGFRLLPLPPATWLQLRMREEDVSQGGLIGGLAFDMPINSRRAGGERRIFRLGPNEWLLSGPEQARSTMEQDVAAALGASFHVVVDVSHRNFMFGLEGARAADVLNAGCPLDLDVRHFPTGMATRTLLGKAEVILTRTSDTPRYEVICWRSFARYLAAFIAEAARP